MPISRSVAELSIWLDASVTRDDLSDGALILLCGIAGAGKTTAATYLESKGFVRLSIDEEIWGRFGRYGLDYAPEAYPDLQRQAAASLWERLRSLLEQKVPVVVDNSFWSRETRDRYMRLAELHGRRWRLLYLKVEPAILRERLRERGERFDANAAFTIDDDLLGRYLKTFEEPSGEGELVFEATSAEE
jgi:predicted kinase